MFVVEFTYQSMKKQAICSIGLLTGGSVISQIGLTYLVIGLLDNFGWQRTLQILGAMLSVICILAALTYIPMNSGPETVDQNLQKKTGFKEYVSLLKNKRFVAFLVANILAGFSYSVTSVHQASKGNIKIKKVHSTLPLCYLDKGCYLFGVLMKRHNFHFWPTTMQF